jgi:hypothetical protein
MNEEFDSILEQCLYQMAAGKARRQSCLLSYPALDRKLDPLLQVAEKLWAMPKPALSPRAKAEIEARLLGTAQTSHRLRSAATRRAGARPRWRWAIEGLSAAFVAILLFTASAAAASTSLPASPLYPVKLATEGAWLWLAPTHDEPRLHLLFAHRRLDEAMLLARQGRFDPATLEAMNAETEAALTDLQDLPPALAWPLLGDLTALTAEQTRELSAWLDDAPAALKPYLAAALQASEGYAGQVQALGQTLRPPEPPGLTKTPEPPGLTKTPEPPGLTKTPEPPGLTKTPEPPGLTKTPEPPGLTKTPEPPGQTRTPWPPARAKTSVPPGLTKTPEPPGKTKAPESPGQPGMPKPTKGPKPAKGPKP